MFHKFRVAFDIVRLIKNWPDYFLNYFGFSGKKNIVYTLRNGFKYEVRSGTADFGTILEIWAHRVYTPAGFKILPGDVVVDIGAHVGIFSVFASKYVKSGVVYAVEPIPDNFVMIKKNLVINSINNVIPVNFAIADKKGEKTLFLPADGDWVGSLHETGSNSKRMTVSAISFKDFFVANNISKINFLKMDCEGAEYDIFFSCSAGLLKKIEKISMEYHNLDETRNVGVLKNFLEKHGFDVKLNRKYHTLYAIKK